MSFIDIFFGFFRLTTEFDNFLSQHGIKTRLTTPYTPQQNGVAERKNRTLAEIACCMRIQSNLQESSWAKAVFIANYKINSSVGQSLNKRTPYEQSF